MKKIICYLIKLNIWLILKDKGLELRSYATMFPRVHSGSVYLLKIISILTVLNFLSTLFILEAAMRRNATKHKTDYTEFASNSTTAVEYI